MAVDRETYATRQAELLAALLGTGKAPPGFVAAQADAAGRSLRRKRANAVRHAWPALAAALGDRFDERFHTFARTQAPPAFGDGLTDGLVFASSPFAADARIDDVRVEMLFAHATVARRRGDVGTANWRVRRGVSAGALRLALPYRRLLVVVRLPRLGVRHVVLPSPWRAMRSS